MSPTKSQWLWTAYMTMAAVAIVLSFFSIADSRLSSLRSKQNSQLSQLGIISVAPDGLPLAAMGLVVNVRVQDRDFPIDELTQLPAWSTLQTTLSAYAERLKLLDAQGRELDERLRQRSQWTSWASFAAIFAYLVFVALAVIAQRRTAKLEQCHASP